MPEAAATEHTSAIPAEVDEFATYQEEANARDLARRRGDAPSTKDEGEAEGKSSDSNADSSTAATKEEEKEKEIATPPADKGASPDSKTEEQRADAAAPPAAPPQKRKSKSDERFEKLLSAWEKDRDELARLRTGKAEPQESRPAADAKSDAKTDAKADAAPPKPTLSDKDDKGQPKFKTYEEYLDARDQWVRDDIKRETSANTAKTTQEQERTRAEKVVWDEQNKRVTAARTKYADFDAVAFAVPMPEKSTLFHYVLSSEKGTDLLYHFGKNPAELERIQGKAVLSADGKSVVRFDGGLPPVLQAAEFGATVAKLSPTTPPAKRITNAPPPPTVLNGNGAVGSDEVEEALKEGDQEAYTRAANARDLARRRGK